jgi:GTP-binding protein LepA
MTKILNVSPEEIFEISAKTGTNVENLLETVAKKIQPPKGDSQKPLRALIFDSKYDPYKGVIAYVRIVDGEIKNNEKIYLIASKTEGEIKEIGYFKPEFSPTEMLKTGEIGYVATGVKEAGKVRVGDTITKISKFQFPISKVESLPGYKEPKPMVFASIYPENPDDYDLLKEALSKLKLSDASLIFEQETQEALGRGFRCGFLGTLHAEIISERLHREFNLNLIISTPQVSYKIINKKNKEFLIKSASEWPEVSQIQQTLEPWVKLEVMTPTAFLGRVLGILDNLQGKPIQTQYFSQDKTILIYEIPLREIIVGFYDKLKGQTQGFASMNYEILGYRPANLMKLEILIAGKKEEVFSKIVPEETAYESGKNLVKKLKETLPAQLFSVAIQAAIRGKIIARETIKARGRDVIAPLYGGDYTRKRKLLEKQKKGKKELKEKGEVHIPPKVFLEIMKMD